MENTTPSSSAPPYTAGAGGKFRKPPISRKRPSTPYDRPPPTTANNESNESQDGGWLSKFVANPARRLIVSGATRILPSFFSKPESCVADEYEDDSSSDRDYEDVDAAVNALDDAKHNLEIGESNLSSIAGPSSQVDKLKGSSEHVNVQQDKSKKSIDDVGVDQIENLLKGKQFSRDESMRLMEILKSRLADDSNDRGEEKPATVISLGQGKGNVSDHEMPSTSNIRKQYDMETPRPRLQSNIQDEVAASPIDIAKAYMGSRTSDLGINNTTYNNITTARREQQTHDMFPSKPQFFTPSSKSSTCWPGAMVQNQHSYLTPQSQRSRYGLHNVPRTPYSRTKSKLNQLQGDGKAPNISLTTFQQSRQQAKTSSDVMDGGYGSVGPIRRVRNKFASESKSVTPTILSSAQVAPFSSTSRSFTPVFQKKPLNSGTSNLHTADKPEPTFNKESSPAGPQNETVRKILEHLDRHKPTPKEKAAELELVTKWKRPSSSQDNNIALAFAAPTGPDFQKSDVSSDGGYLNRPSGGVSFKDQVIPSNAEIKTSASVNDDASTGPSFGFKNSGNEKSTDTNSKENEKVQPWSFDNKINGQDLTKKRPSQPILKPISFKRPDPQQVVSSDNGRGFTFSFPATTSSASEPPTPSIMPSFPPHVAPQSKEMPALPTYSFGMNRSSERVVFSFPSTSSASVDDGASDLKFNFGSGKKRLSFASIGSDAIVIS